MTASWFCGETAVVEQLTINKNNPKIDKSLIMASSCLYYYFLNTPSACGGELHFYIRYFFGKLEKGETNDIEWEMGSLQ